MPKRKHVAIILDVTSEYDRDVLHGISRYVHEDDLWTIDLHNEQRHLLAQLQRWRGHGIIANIDTPGVLNAVKRLRVPVVGFGGGAVMDDQIHFLAGSNEEIARLGVEHLIERGFNSFAFCGWPSNRTNPWSLARGKAFSQIIREAGFQCSIFPARASVRHFDTLLDEMSQWIKSLPKPLGLMAANDARARQVLDACREIQVSVPDEVAVIGVDNNELICNLSIPRLSSIMHGGKQLGYEAGALLKRLMEKPFSKEGSLGVVPPAGVFTRQSTDTVAIEDPVVATAVRFIRDESARPLQVRDVVSQVDVSRATLEKRFKQLVGGTIHGEIRRVQIRQVQHLLRTTDLPMHKIAERTGFQYVQYLAAVFRQVCGQTPGQYREHARLEKP
jgi:LacI family transcriptional regulator